MTDWLSPSQRSRNMASIRSKGNATTELRLVRLMREAHITGWRRHQDLPGKPDFVFPIARVVVFVDGCFWHGCPQCYRLPGDNRTYWRGKIKANRSRDRRNAGRLRSKGWRVIRIWEHKLENSRSRPTIISRLKRLLGSRRRLSSSAPRPSKSTS